MTGASAVCNDEVHYVMPEMHLYEAKNVFCGGGILFFGYISKYCNNF